MTVTVLMPVRDPFPDIQAAMMDVIDAAGITGTDGTLTSGVETPADFAGSLPFARVHRLGGGDDGITDSASVTIDVFASKYADAFGISEELRQIFTSGPISVGPAVLGYSTVVTGPLYIPWSANDSPRRFATTYRTTARR